MTSANNAMLLRNERANRGPRWRDRLGGFRFRRSDVLLAALLYAFFGVFLIWPIAQVVYTGFVTPGGSLTFRYVGLIFASPVLREGLYNATLVAVLVTS